MEQKRFYPDMSPEQQLQWVTDFEALMADGGNRIVETARSRSPQWTSDDAQIVRRIVALLAAWPFAADFCEKAQRYGDYMARTSRLPIYIEKVKERLADGLTMTDQQGSTVAYVSPSTPMRRRGRPTKEEVAARLRGETVTVAETDSPENEKRRRIAAILGLQVIVHGEAPREKNNAELAAERAAKKAAYDRQNPSLFGSGDSAVGDDASRNNDGGSPYNDIPLSRHPDNNPAPAETASFSCPTMSEVYQSRIEQDRLRLSDLAWLCSDELKQRIPTVQALRVTAESSSERAKTMADMGADPKDIEPYAQQAKDATEAYLAIYAAVDEEMAIQFKRLSIDQPYIDRFKQRFRGVDLEKVLHICRPYYEKVKEQERKAVEEIRAKAKEKGENEEQAVAAYLADHQPIDQRIKNLIERDNPEYAARMKAEEEKKQEIQSLHRYIMRKDKDASDERVKTMTERIARIRELAGDEVADSYLPVLEKTLADNIAWRAAKAASKQEKSDAGTDSSEREQTRRESVKGKPSPKKSAKKD